MALAILPAFIASFIVLIVLLGTYYVYQACKRVRPAVPDVERTRHIENINQFNQQPMQLRNIESPHEQSHSFQRYGSEYVVPGNIAPVAKPLPQVPEIEYTGGEGLVSSPRRVFLSEDVKESNKGRTKESGYFEEQALHAGRPWNFATDGYGNSMTQQPELSSPRPVRTVTRSPKAEPASTAYDQAQAAAADIWARINKGELQPSRRKPGKKLPKSPNIPTGEVLRDPAEFENDVLQDIDLGSSTKEWAKAKVSSAYVTKRPSKRDSFDSTITAVDANNVNIERPVSYVKCKQSIDSDAVRPSQPLGRAAEARRKILEAREQMVERKKREEEEERQSEERRQEEEQNQRAAEQQRLAEEKKRQKNEERAWSLKEVTKTEDLDRYDTNGSRPRRPSTSRRSDSSTESKRERKSRDKPLTQSSKRAYTFADDSTTSADDSVMEKKPSDSCSGMARSMSMNDQKRPDLNTTMPSIAEGGSTNDGDKRDIDDSRTRKLANPFSDKMARHSDGSTKTSALPGYPSKYKNGNTISRGVAENPFTSIEDAEVSFAPAERFSGTSNTESRSQAQRRSNASSKDSRLSSDSRRSLSYPERKNSRSSALSRASADSQSSKQSATDRERPERKSSFASRTLGKLGRKSSSSDKRNERDSAGSTQSWERDGLGLRGGGELFVAEPEEMSESNNEHGDAHEDWGYQEEEGKVGVRIRGGAGEKTVESGSESVTGMKDDESDAGEVGHSDNDDSEDEHSESGDDTEEHDSSEDEVSEDRASEDEHSESEVSTDEASDAGASDDESGGEVSDDEHDQTLLQKPAGIVSTKTLGRVKARGSPD